MCHPHHHSHGPIAQNRMIWFMCATQYCAQEKQLYMHVSIQTSHTIATLVLRMTSLCHSTLRMFHDALFCTDASNEYIRHNTTTVSAYWHHTLLPVRKSGGTFPGILNFRPKQWWVVSGFIPTERAPVFNGGKNGRAPESVWTLWSKNKSIILLGTEPGSQFAGRSARSLIHLTYSDMNLHVFPGAKIRWAGRSWHIQKYTLSQQTSLHAPHCLHKHAHYI